MWLLNAISLLHQHHHRRMSFPDFYNDIVGYVATILLYVYIQHKQHHHQQHHEAARTVAIAATAEQQI